MLSNLMKTWGKRDNRKLRKSIEIVRNICRSDVEKLLCFKMFPLADINPRDWKLLSGIFVTFFCSSQFHLLSFPPFILRFNLKPLFWSEFFYCSRWWWISSALPLSIAIKNIFFCFKALARQHKFCFFCLPLCRLKIKLQWRLFDKREWGKFLIHFFFPFVLMLSYHTDDETISL